MSKERYKGRLVCDGEGNLLAHEADVLGQKTVSVTDEDGPVLGPDGAQVTVTVPIVRLGENHGKPLYHDVEDDAYYFLLPGEPSHNERHHKQFAAVTGTVDATMTDEPELVNAGWSHDGKTNFGNDHHFGTQPDDKHYEEGATNDRGLVTNTRAKSHPDYLSPFVTGHTEAYTS